MSKDLVPAAVIESIAGKAARIVIDTAHPTLVDLIMPGAETAEVTALEAHDNRMPPSPTNHITVRQSTTKARPFWRSSI